MSSDHLVPLVDLTPWFDGSDRSDVLRARGPLPADEAMAYVLQACEAIAEAHASAQGHCQPYEKEYQLADGRRVPFDRDKLARSVRIALRKRPFDEERIERIVTGIQRRLEVEADSEVTSRRVGEVVLETLRDVDEVAYVRFASVYRNFREAKDFQAFLSNTDGG